MNKILIEILEKLTKFMWVYWFLLGWLIARLIIEFIFIITDGCLRIKQKQKYIKKLKKQKARLKGEENE